MPSNKKAYDALQVESCLRVLIDFHESAQAQAPAPQPVPLEFQEAFQGCEWSWEDCWKDFMFRQWCVEECIDPVTFLPLPQSAM